MKTIIIAALLTLTGTNSLSKPVVYQQIQNPVDIVDTAITAIRQGITAAGYDPYVLESAKFDYELPLLGIFSVHASVENIKSTGISNIVTDELNYSNITKKLNFNIALPQIYVSMGGAKAEIFIIGFFNLPLDLGGTISVADLRIKGEAYVHLGESKTIVKDLVVSCSLGGIKSDIHLSIFGNDLSSYANIFLSSTLQTIISSNMEQINQYIENAIMAYLNTNL